MEFSTCIIIISRGEMHQSTVMMRRRKILDLPGIRSINIASEDLRYVCMAEKESQQD